MSGEHCSKNTLLWWMTAILHMVQWAYGYHTASGLVNHYTDQQVKYWSYLPQGCFLAFLSHDQDTIHAEKACAEMHDFCMAAVVFLTGHGIKARTHAHAEITHFLMRGIIRTWKALSLQPRTFRPWWCTSLGNVQFPHGHGFLFICHDVGNRAETNKGEISSQYFKREYYALGPWPVIMMWNVQASSRYNRTIHQTTIIVIIMAIEKMPNVINILHFLK